MKVAEKFNLLRSFRRHSQKSRKEIVFLHYLISISNLLTNSQKYFLKCKQNCSKNEFIAVPKQVYKSGDLAPPTPCGVEEEE